MLKDLLNKLYTVEHIPSNSQIKVKIQDILLDIDTTDEDDIQELAKFISYDPSLTLLLLKIVNSDSFGFRNKISSIEDAIQLLDPQLLKLVISQHPVLPDMEAYHSNVEDTFDRIIIHSIEVQIIIQVMFDMVLSETIKDDTFRYELKTASIVHDIGFIFLLVYYPEYYEDIYERMRSIIVPGERGKRYTLPEHSFIGSLICEAWYLPPSIRNTVAFHHFPWTGSEESRLASEILYVADSISSSFYEMFDIEDDVYSIEEHIIMKQNMMDILERLNIQITELAAIRARAGDILEGELALMGMS